MQFHRYRQNFGNTFYILPAIVLEWMKTTKYPETRTLTVGVEVFFWGFYFDVKY
jgi:hypothetical protein